MTARDKHIYNSQTWQRLRRVKLQDNALCEACLVLGRLVPATVVDHRTPISSGGDAFPTVDGLMSMCEACHNRKTRGEQHGDAFIMKGADAPGLPIDLNHPFFGNGVSPSNHKRFQSVDRAASRKVTKILRRE
jgi:5-methylcytosine-specific restriction protein A